ncbi:hypothetical protein Tco_0316347 [Tanacetum coccineum]
MYENKSFNRNPANHALYHAFMKSLIEDENIMDKGVANTVKDHKINHDDDDEDDDEDRSAGPNQGKKTKRGRTKESDSSKKPSTTKETPKGKASSKGPITGKSATTKEPIEEPIVEVEMDDPVNTAAKDVVLDADQLHDDSTQAKDKAPKQDWFKQPLRPPTPYPEWNKRQVVLDQIEQPWFNQMVSNTKDPLTFNDLMATPIDFSKYINLIGIIHKEIVTPSKPLPLQGRLGHLTVAIDYFFNDDLEYLKSSDLERMYTTSIMKTKVALYEILYKFKEGDFVDLHLSDIEDMLLHAVQHNLFHLNENDIVDFIVALRMFTRSLVIKKRIEDLHLGVESYQKKLNITEPQNTFPEIEFKKLYTLSYNSSGVIYEDLNKHKRVMWADELYKFSDGTLMKVSNKLHHRILNFRLGYNDKMSRRKWTAIDRKRSQLMVELIDKHMHERRIIQNLERLVGARELKMDYKLMTRTV